MSMLSVSTKLHFLLKHPPCCCLIKSSASRVVVVHRAITTTAAFKAERAAKQAKRKAVAEQRAAAEAYFANTFQKTKQQQEYPLKEKKNIDDDEYNNNNKNIHEGKIPQLDGMDDTWTTRGEVWRAQERQHLLEEAGFMARSLYRTCLRSINLMRVGNDHDEAEFQAREEKRLNDMDDTDIDVLDMEGPVDRENELRSRAEYYYSHVREHYNSDFQCLDRNPWKENEVESFLHFIKSGEKKRRYVLKDYKFDDPYKSVFDRNRVKEFERRANELLQDTYQANGWMLSTDMKALDDDTEHDPEFVFEDDSEERKVKV